MRGLVASLVALAILHVDARAAAQAASPAPPTSPAPASSSPPEETNTPPAAGEGVAEPASPTKQPEIAEVRVIGSKADALPKVPGSGTVIGAKDLKRAQPVDAAEMLRRVPGVQVRQDYGAGNRIDISVRGLDSGRSRRVLLLEDGIPIAVNPYSEPDMYYAPSIERYRSIEVVKGSGNILFGPQTLAGTINFVTLEPPEKPTLAVDVDAGNYGYVRSLASYGDRIGESRYVVQVLRREGDGFRNLPFESTDALGKLAVPTGENGNLTFKLGYHRDDAASDDIGLTAAMYRTTPRRPSLSPKSHLVVDRFDVSLTHEQRFSRSTSLKTLVYAYRTDRIWRRQDYTRQPRPGQVYESIVGDVTVPLGAIYLGTENVILDRTYDVYGVEPRAEHRFKTGSIGHTLEFGGRVLRETASYEQRSGGYVETYAGRLDFKEQHGGTALAAYVQDRIAFTEKLLVVPGVRFEYLAFRRVILRRSDEGATRDVYEPQSSSVDALIPGIGLVYGTRAAHVFAGLHRGFAPPRITTALSPRAVPTNVGADESTNYEIGTRVSPWKWARLQTAGFSSVYRNQVITDTTAGNDVALIDAGGTRLFGVESAATTAIGQALHLPVELDLGVRHTYSRATFRYLPNAGNLLPYAPEHAVSANADVEHASGFGGQVAYSYVGKQYTDALNSEVEDVTGRLGAIDPRHLLDATIHYRHAKTGITVRLSAKNLLDQTYVVARRPEGIHPGAFRQILLGLRWDWEQR